MNKVKFLFGSLIAFVLLGFYVYGVVYAIRAVNCLAHTGCQQYSAQLTDSIAFVLTTIGGLVSALVVAELAVTQPGQTPGTRFVTDIPSKWVSGTVVAYMVVWLGCGVCSIIVGYFQHDNLVPPLTAAAKSWFGVALAATYSYFGIKPNG